MSNAGQHREGRKHDRHGSPQADPGHETGHLQEEEAAYANRHGYASEAASLGFSDSQVAEQLGNTPDVLRRVYAHSIDDHAADRAREIAERRRRRK